MNQEKEKTMRQILEKIGPLLRGSLSVAYKKCGKNCSTCREKGGHPATYFGYRKEGKTLVVHLPSSRVELAELPQFHIYGALEVYLKLALQFLNFHPLRKV